MKKIFFTLLLFLATATLFSQTISPITTSEQCPGINITFTVTITAKSIIAVNPKALNVNPTVVQQPFNIIVNGGTITFSFVGKFADYNNKQTFAVTYSDANNLLQTWDATFIKIKSLQTANSFSQIYPNLTNISAPYCQTQSFNVSFANVQYGNPWEAPPIGYGTVTNYQYLLPNGWKLGTQTSNGTTWLNGNNNVTITSDLSTGNGTNIRIRPVNTACATGLATGQEAYISISRPNPSLNLTTNPSSINCGSSTPVTFTISGSATGITGYTWNLGSSNNRWLYNGSPAPTSINTGTTNTLTLTPDVSTGTAPSQVSVTVNFTGGCQVNYFKNLPFIVPSGSYTILGYDIPCTNMITTYSLQQTPPSGTTVTWDIAPNDGTITLTPNGNSVDVDASAATKNQNYHLTATISGYCYYATTLKQFTIPTASFMGQVYGLSGWNTYYGNALVEGDNYFYLYGSNVFEVWIQDNLGQSYSNGWWEHISGDYATGGNYMYLYFDTYSYGPPDSYYNYHFTDNCGSHSIPFHFISVYSYPPSYRMQINNEPKLTLKISPNPASDFVMITIQEPTSNAKLSIKPVTSGFDYNSPKRISVYDKLGNIVLQQKAIISKSGFRLNISSIKQKDIYNIIVEDAKGNKLSGRFIKY